LPKGFGKSGSVVETALEEDQPRLIFAALHAVDQPVFLGYAAGPEHVS
jgi:hypothetical protein